MYEAEIAQTSKPQVEQLTSMSPDLASSMASWNMLICVLGGSSGAKQTTERLSEGLKIIPVTLSVLLAGVAKASL